MPAPIVIKIGGALLGDLATLQPFWKNIGSLAERAPVVVVHGGGQQATAMAQRLDHTPRIVQGRRVTSDLDLSIIQWTLRGELNTQLVAQAQSLGLPAVGLSGVDGGTLRVSKRPPWQINGEEVDFGWVGDVESVEPKLIHDLLKAGHLPILAPMGLDALGKMYNVNADTVSYSLAAALNASRFLLVTESGGVRRDKDDPASLQYEIDAETFESGVTAGWIEGGMRVKLKVAFDALEAGIPYVSILSIEDLLFPEKGTRVI